MNRKMRKWYATDEEYALLCGYAADHGRDPAEIVRSAVLSTIKREAGRSGLLAEIDRIVGRRVSDALAGRSASAEVVGIGRLA